MRSCGNKDVLSKKLFVIYVKKVFEKFKRKRSKLEAINPS